MTERGLLPKLGENEMEKNRGVKAKGARSSGRQDSPRTQENRKGRPEKLSTGWA